MRQQESDAASAARLQQDLDCAAEENAALRCKLQDTEGQVRRFWEACQIVYFFFTFRVLSGSLCSGGAEGPRDPFEPSSNRCPRGGGFLCCQCTGMQCMNSSLLSATSFPPWYLAEQVRTAYAAEEAAAGARWRAEKHIAQVEAAARQAHQKQSASVAETQAEAHRMQQARACAQRAVPAARVTNVVALCCCKTFSCTERTTHGCCTAAAECSFG